MNQTFTVQGMTYAGGQIQIINSSALRQLGSARAS